MRKFEEKEGTYYSGTNKVYTYKVKIESYKKCDIKEIKQKVNEFLTSPQK